MRDLDEKPYSTDEQRVADWLASKGIGGGDDPIGFILISYEDMRKQLGYQKIVNQLMNI